MQKESQLDAGQLDFFCSFANITAIHCGQAMDEFYKHEALFSCAPWGGNTPKPGRTERSRKGPFCVLDRQGASANGPAWAAPRIIRRKEDPLRSRLGKMAAHLGKSLGMVTKT